MLRIGDFSRLTNIPIKTIRYYDEIGLLKPTSVCIENNYRYYGMDQLIALNKILALKDAGFTLEEIRHLMKERLSRDEFLNLLNNKLSIAEHELTFTQMKVSNLRARIKHIKNEEDYKMVDVTVKKIEPILVAAIRKSVDTDKHGSLYGIIIDDVAAHGLRKLGRFYVCDTMMSAIGKLAYKLEKSTFPVTRTSLSIICLRLKKWLALFTKALGAML